MKKVHAFILIVIIFISGAVYFLYNKKGEAKILFVGDMMFDRYIRQVGQEKGADFIFSCRDSNGVSLSDFLKKFDLVVGNLEGPITNNQSISLGSVIESPENFTFTFPSTVAKLLAKNNIKVVSLDNNHIGNFGQEGIISTKSYLDKAGVNYIDSNFIFRTEIGGTKISFISYNEFLPVRAGGGDSYEKVAQKIEEEKEKGRIILVYTHWGNEYVEAPERVKNIANLFVKNGADLIVGSHPHIILASEKINNVFVYYSLGNFIFDQYWNKEVSTGLILEVGIKNGKIGIVEHKVSLNRDGRTCLVN